MFTEELREKLSQPIDPRRVKTREGGGGKSLSYIEAHDAIRTANEIFGTGSWGYDVVELVHLGTEPFKKNDRSGHRTAYRAVVRVAADGEDHGFAAFTDVGYGDATEYTASTLTTHELAAKEAVSDGVKRALKNFGDPFGLGLYSAAGRDEVAAARRELSALPALKRQVYELGVAKLGNDKPTTAQVAKAFGVKTAELQQLSVLQRIVAENA